MTAIRNFRDLIVWQKAHEFVLVIYHLTKLFPDDEKFGLTSQIRRAAVSVAANIAEGFARFGKQDKLRFYNIAQGSLEETKYYLILAKDLGYTKDIVGEGKLAGDVGRLLYALMTSIKQ
jgi:four helix bundle protein